MRILPHDLIHAIIENLFGVSGFIDLSFKGISPKAASEEAWLAEAMVESVQGMLWSGTLDYIQFNDWIQSICAQRGVPCFNARSEDFDRLKKSLENYSEKWSATPTGGSLRFLWHKS